MSRVGAITPLRSSRALFFSQSFYIFSHTTDDYPDSAKDPTLSDRVATVIGERASTRDAGDDNAFPSESSGVEKLCARSRPRREEPMDGRGEGDACLSVCVVRPAQTESYGVGCTSHVARVCLAEFLGVFAANGLHENPKCVFLWV